MSEHPVLTPPVRDAIAAHMNDDHRDDALLIVQQLGARGDATAATLTDLDADGITFSAVVPEGIVAVRVPWSEPIESRGQVRLEVVRMYHDACVRAGIEVRPTGEH